MPVRSATSLRDSDMAFAANGLFVLLLSCARPSSSATGSDPSATAASRASMLSFETSVPLCTMAMTRSARTNWSLPRYPWRLMSASCHARESASLGRPESPKNSTASLPVTRPSWSWSARPNHRLYTSSSETGRGESGAGSGSVDSSIVPGSCAGAAFKRPSHTQGPRFRRPAEMTCWHYSLPRPAPVAPSHGRPPRLEGGSDAAMSYA